MKTGVNYVNLLWTVSRMLMSSRETQDRVIGRDSYRWLDRCCVATPVLITADFSITLTDTSTYHITKRVFHKYTLNWWTPQFLWDTIASQIRLISNSAVVKIYPTGLIKPYLPHFYPLFPTFIFKHKHAMLLTSDRVDSISAGGLTWLFHSIK